MQKPEWVKKLQANKAFFTAAGRIVETIHHAREGGKLSSVLAGVAAVGELSTVLWPQEGSNQALNNKGLTEHVDLALAGLYCDLLKTHQPPQIIASNTWSSTVMWVDREGAPVAGAVYYSGQFSEGPYVTPGGYERLIDLIREAVWSKADSLVVSTTRKADMTYKGASRYRFDTMNPLGDYVRKRGADWYVEQLQEYPPGPLTVLLRGPTGMGKSVLARHIAKGLRPYAPRTLKVSSKVLDGCNSNEIFCLARTLRPAVLLLDDLDLKDRTKTSTLLDILEMLRDPNCLVIVTMMTPPEHVEKPPEDGSWHFAGMRPERIDIAWTLYPLDEEEREMVIRHYIKIPVPDQMMHLLVEKTKDLTGAYIMDYCRRLSNKGVDAWEEQGNLVRYMAPLNQDRRKGPRDPDEPDEDADDGPTRTYKYAADTHPQG